MHGRQRLRIGSVPFLNVQPLVWALECDDGQLSRRFGYQLEITGVAPRLLAQMLHRGEFDVAMVPVFEYLRHPEYTILPGVCIGTRCSVGSVTLFTDVPLEQVETVLLDPASLTSVNLLKVLLAERGVCVTYREEAGESRAPLPPRTGRLLIGDRALAELGAHGFAYDLGGLWHEQTGMGFVFAAWLVHPSAQQMALNDLFVEAKRIGTANLERVADERALAFGSSAGFALRYFRENLCYDLEQVHIDGWCRFASLCVDHGLCSSLPPLVFHRF